MKKMVIAGFLLILLAACTSKNASVPLPPTLVKLSPLPPTLVNSAKLTVNETQVVAADVDTPDHFEFNDRISSEVRDLHAVWKYGNPVLLVETPNQILAPFGYRLQQNPIMSSYSFQLFKGDTLVVDEISFFFPPTVKSDGSDFAMLMDLKNGDELIAISGTVGKWSTDGLMKEYPIYAGDKLVTAFYENNSVVVTANDEKIFSTPAEFLVENPIKSLRAWQGHWVLEVEGKVFVDGESLNKSQGYAEIFDWHLIKGQPFFFFTKIKGGEVGVSYGGTVLPYSYTEVIHYKCCEPAAFNPGFSEHMVWFYGLRDGMWYYVEMGIYE
jgi:hypothetical protein